MTQVFSTIQGGDGVIAYWGFEGVDPFPPLLVLFLDFAILNLLTLLCMRPKRSKLVVVDSFTSSSSSSSSSGFGFPSTSATEEGDNDGDASSRPSTSTRRVTWRIALWQALGGELGTNSDDCAPSLVERLLGPMVDDADLEFFHAKAQERQQQRYSEGGGGIGAHVDDDVATSQMHEVDERGFTAKDRAAEHLASMHPMDVTSSGGGRSSFYDSPGDDVYEDDEEDGDANSISGEGESSDRGSTIWGSSRRKSRSSRTSRGHRYSFSPETGAEQSKGATLVFRDLRFR